MSVQLALNLRLKDSSSFENFYAAHNREALERVRAAVEALARDAGAERALFLCGPLGSGKTHLLQAACRLAQERGLAPVYVPLAEAGGLAPAMLEDLETARLVCLDDVGAIAGDVTWERALFSLAERLRAVAGLLIGSGAASPAQLGLRQPEFATRLAWGPVYQLHVLGDAERLAAIRLRARNRGFEMTEEAARYILARHPRDMHSLFALLERIDAASLASQRRVTVPFIKTVEGVTSDK